MPFDPNVASGLFIDVLPLHAAKFPGLKPTINAVLPVYGGKAAIAATPRASQCSVTDMLLK